MANLQLLHDRGQPATFSQALSPTYAIDEGDIARSPYPVRRSYPPMHPPPSPSLALTQLTALARAANVACAHTAVRRSSGRLQEKEDLEVEGVGACGSLGAPFDVALTTASWSAFIAFIANNASLPQCLTLLSAFRRQAQVPPAGRRAERGSLQ